MWKSELFLKKVYRSSMQTLSDAVTFLESEDGPAFLRKLENLRDDICAYLRAYYFQEFLFDDSYQKIYVVNQTEVDKDFFKSLTQDGIETNKLSRSYGIYRYTHLFSSNTTVGTQVTGGGDTPQKSKLKFLYDKSQLSLKGNIDDAYVLINSDFKQIFIIIYYTFHIDEKTKDNDDLINKISFATGVSVSDLRIRNEFVYHCVEYDNITEEELDEKILQSPQNS